MTIVHVADWTNIDSVTDLNLAFLIDKLVYLIKMIYLLEHILRIVLNFGIILFHDFSEILNAQLLDNFLIVSIYIRQVPFD
jgi:hypothetical protein